MTPADFSRLHVNAFMTYTIVAKTKRVRVRVSVCARVCVCARACAPTCVCAKVFRTFKSNINASKYEIP